MVFIETPTFTRLVLALLHDDEYRELQVAMMEDPERGDIIATCSSRYSSSCKSANTKRVKVGVSMNTMA